MSANSFFAKFLRFAGIVLMGLTSGFTLLGGAGTSCVALNPTGFGENMAPLAPFQWLYILFVLTGVALGILGIRATVMLIKGRDKSYRDAIVVLITGVVIGVVHMAVSQALRGKSMPVDGVVYTTVITLAIFLLFRVPTIWQAVNFAKGNRNDSNLAGGAAAIVFGLMTLTIQFTMGPTHTWNGVNYADAFNTAMSLVGVGSLLVGTSQFLPRSLTGVEHRYPSYSQGKPFPSKFVRSEDIELNRPLCGKIQPESRAGISRCRLIPPCSKHDHSKG